MAAGGRPRRLGTARLGSAQRAHTRTAHARTHTGSGRRRSGAAGPAAPASPAGPGRAGSGEPGPGRRRRRRRRTARRCCPARRRPHGAGRAASRGAGERRGPGSGLCGRGLHLAAGTAPHRTARPGSTAPRRAAPRALCRPPPPQPAPQPPPEKIPRRPIGRSARCSPHRQPIAACLPGVEPFHAGSPTSQLATLACVRSQAANRSLSLWHRPITCCFPHLPIGCSA